MLLLTALLLAPDLLPIPAGEQAVRDSATGFTVQVRTGVFSLGRTEVTQAQYTALMGANPSHYKGPNRPVENVTWRQAIEYTNRLSAAEKLTPCYNLATGRRLPGCTGYRLPTSAEWQLALGTPDKSAFRNSGYTDTQTLLDAPHTADVEVWDNQVTVQLRDDWKVNGHEYLRGMLLVESLDDFLEQMQSLKKMGPLGGLMGMMPGMPKELKNAEIGDDQLKPVEAIIRSMTPTERRKPEIINGSRRTRIANGSGTSVAEVNRLIKQFTEMQKMMKQMGGLAGRKAGKKGKPPKMNPVKMAKAMKQMGSGDLSGLGNLAGGAGFPGNPGLPGTKNGEAFPDFREFR